MSVPERLGHDNLGLGVGLRAVHFDHILREQPAVLRVEAAVLLHRFGQRGVHVLARVQQGAGPRA